MDYVLLHCNIVFFDTNIRKNDFQSNYKNIDNHLIIRTLFYNVINNKLFNKKMTNFRNYDE